VKGGRHLGPWWQPTKENILFKTGDYVRKNVHWFIKKFKTPRNPENPEKRICYPIIISGF
jgi:hypothetical protein